MAKDSGTSSGFQERKQSIIMWVISVYSETSGDRECENKESNLADKVI